MFEQAFRNIDDALRKEAGCTTELDYTEQSSWLLFLKYLDALEWSKEQEAKLESRKYSFILEPAYRWESWAAPKNAKGEIDHQKALTGDDLRDFVNEKLFPYLQKFKQKATGPNTVEYKIGEIFGEIKNKIQSGYNLREIVEVIDGLRFGSQKEKHELSELYEAKIRKMGNAGRNGGEYYTPRPLIRAIVKVLKPQIAELFQKDVRTINEHLQNMFEEGELERGATIRKFRIVRLEGSREVAREVEHYSLPAILAIGCRVRSPRGWRRARCSVSYGSTRRRDRSSHP